MIMRQAVDLARKGLRVLALAYGSQKNALTFAGLVGMADPPRPGVRDSIAIMRQSKVHCGGWRFRRGMCGGPRG
jgi:P-type Ca2+ transporter type 2C